MRAKDIFDTRVSRFYCVFLIRKIILIYLAPCGSGLVWTAPIIPVSHLGIRVFQSKSRYILVDNFQSIPGCSYFMKSIASNANVLQETLDNVDKYYVSQNLPKVSFQRDKFSTKPGIISRGLRGQREGEIHQSVGYGMSQMQFLIQLLVDSLVLEWQ